MTSPIRQRLPSVAGVLYSSAGFVLLMGIITAETKYPGFRHYTTRQEISDLGGTRPPHGLVTQPSAMIFDTTMLIAGVLLLAGAFALWRLYRDRVLTVVSTLFGAGTLGEVSIQADDASLFVYTAGSKAVLAVLSPQGGNAGLIHLEARMAAKEIGDLF